jgi:diadenosine tetraphosphate (Ap4A) HIT family hydrolase
MNADIDEAAGPASVFASPAVLRRAFERKLLGLLEHDGLGVFILVLANASFERATFARLRDPLARIFAEWEQRFRDHDEREFAAAADDVEVFRRLCCHGFDNLMATRWRRLGPWELQFNQLRAFRPPRVSGAPVSHLEQSFDPDGFHFNKPFLRKEIFWEGNLGGAPVRLLYNKFPFAEMHGLLVPHPEANKPQYLTSDDHLLVWEISDQLGRGLPDIGFGYNAYGAYASVNHLHFQMFMRSSGRYTIESEQWLHNGGNEPFPLAVQRHSDRDSAWSALSDLHAMGHTYNLVYRPGSLYIVARAMQGAVAHSDWSSGFAWSEVAGAVTTFDEADFERLSQGDIAAELSRLTVRP